jgi:2-methylcitrate dehydratase
MSTERELFWQNYDATCRNSIAYHFAQYALGLGYDSLPPEVVHQAKRSLLDALGNAIGAYSSPGRPVCEAAATELGGPREATLFGSGKRTSALNAALVNSFLIRFHDYHDLGGNHHGCDAIASILAVCERQKAGGRDFLTSLAISYELGARVRLMESHKPLQGGFIFDTRYSLIMPPPLGKLMGLNAEQIANAIGICASHSMALQVIMSEEPTMSKNIRAGFIAHDALLCCILAKNGFTGPTRVVEGVSGLIETTSPGFDNIAGLINFSGWKILETRHKYLRGCAILQSLVSATLSIVRGNNLMPAEIASVKIKCSPRFMTLFGRPLFKYPRNAESADHSMWYTTAIAIKERRLGPKSYEPENFTDPVVLDLIDKITVEPGPDVGHYEGISEIATRDGRHFVNRVDTPHGFGDDPLSDAELEEKFREMAAEYISEKKIRRIFDTVWYLDCLEDIRKLTARMVFMRRPATHRMGRQNTA